MFIWFIYYVSLFGKELFILFAASAFRKLSSIYVFSYFPFGFEGRIWDLIVSVPDHCLSFYFVPSKIYDKSDDFDFDVVNFPFLDGDVPRSTSYGVYIAQLIRFARVCSHVLISMPVIKV